MYNKICNDIQSAEVQFCSVLKIPDFEKIYTLEPAKIFLTSDAVNPRVLSVNPERLFCEPP